MARDIKKYAYYTIGILRDSETHRALLRDAEEHNTKQIPTIIGIRVSEYYRLRAQGVPTVPQPLPEITIEAEKDLDCDHTAAIGNAKASLGAWAED